ncbi:MAG: hypothetical protein GY856_26870 [bacterium]|nr:hypothetical protein [bacterium]
MNRFAPQLQKISDQLVLPPPTRSRILLEMAADLEDLFEYHLARGCDEAEAARRAEETLAASDDTLRHLVTIHQSGFNRFVDRLSAQARSRWERVVLVALVAFAVLYTGRTMATAEWLTHASVFIWPIWAIGGIAFALIVTKLYALFLKRDRDVRRLRSGLGTILLLAVASLVTGAYGFFVELYLYFRSIVESGKGFPVEWMLKVSIMVNLSLIVAIATALAWFVLVNLVTRIENLEAAVILDS